MVEAVPLEQDEPGLDIDLLDDRVEHDRVRGWWICEASQTTGYSIAIRAVPCGVSSNSCRSAMRPLPALTAPIWW